VQYSQSFYYELNKTNILTYLQYKEEPTFSYLDLAQKFKCSVPTVANYVSALKRSGYLDIIRYRDESGRYTTAEWSVYQYPQESIIEKYKDNINAKPTEKIIIVKPQKFICPLSKFQHGKDIKKYKDEGCADRKCAHYEECTKPFKATFEELEKKLKTKKQQLDKQLYIDDEQLNFIPSDTASANTQLLNDSKLTLEIGDEWRSEELAKIYIENPSNYKSWEIDLLPPLTYAHAIDILTPHNRQSIITVISKWRSAKITLMNYELNYTIRAIYETYGRLSTKRLDTMLDIIRPYNLPPKYEMFKRVFIDKVQGDFKERLQSTTPHLDELNIPSFIEIAQQKKESEMA
jgi:hypothetical protein